MAGSRGSTRFLSRRRKCYEQFSEGLTKSGPSPLTAYILGTWRDSKWRAMLWTTKIGIWSLILEWSEWTKFDALFSEVCTRSGCVRWWQILLEDV